MQTFREPWFLILLCLTAINTTTRHWSFCVPRPPCSLKACAEERARSLLYIARRSASACACTNIAEPGASACAVSANRGLPRPWSSSVKDVTWACARPWRSFPASDNMTDLTIPDVPVSRPPRLHRWENLDQKHASRPHACPPFAAEVSLRPVSKLPPTVC